MSYNTYSFADITAVVSHPSYGQYQITGEGIGSITTEMTTERSVQDVSADGTVMVTKVKGRNGTVALSMQQTSSLYRWLRGLYNYLEVASSDQWAQTSIIIKTPGMGELESCTGVSFGKLPSSPRQAAGQNLTWTLMAADIQRDVA